MPRSIDNTYDKHPLVSWTDVSIADIQRLHELKASALQMKVWLVLKTYAWNNRTCFPSLQSICDRMGYVAKSAKQRVCEALKWLDDVGLIQRNHHRQKPDRFVLNKTFRKTGIQRSAKPEHKETQENNTQPPCIPPKGEGLKQKVRSQRRRKRLRKADQQHIAEVAKQNEAHRIAREEAVASYKQAQEQASQVLHTLLEEHENQETPQTQKQATRAFLVASILHYYEWIDGPLTKPDHITLVSHMIEDAEELTWALRLNVFALWEHVRRNAQ